MLALLTPRFVQPRREFFRGVQVLASLLLGFACCPLYAEVSVDPEGTGDDDVVLEPFGPAVPLSNPSNPLLLGSLDLAIGFEGRGAMAVSDGGTVSVSSTFLGFDQNSAGTLSIDGAGSSWLNTGNLFVGRLGSGHVRVEAGGLLDVLGLGVVGGAEGSSGLATIHGPDSRWEVGGRLIVGDRRNSQGDLSIKGLNAAVSVGGELTIGNAGNGFLSVSDGGVLSNDGTSTLGHDRGSTGSAVVLGEGAAWTTGNKIAIGLNGNGGLRIGGGGSVASQDSAFLGASATSRGDLELSGSGSFFGAGRQLIVGSYGQGMLRVLEGAEVRDVAGGRVGSQQGSVGTVEVRGDGSLWTSRRDLAIGSLGSGYLSVRDGGRVQSGSVIVGDDSLALGEVIVEGDDATLSGGSQVVIGNRGSGRLEALRGGSIASVGPGFLGGEAGSVGVARIAGRGSAWTTGNAPLFVGRSGRGELIITEGGSVSTGFASLGREAGASATVLISGHGSTWSAGADLVIGDAGMGTLDISDGGRLLVENDLVVGKQASSAGSLRFDNGLLRAGGLIGSLDDISTSGPGGGTIETNGLVSDIDLSFENLTGQTRLVSVPGQDVAIRLRPTSAGSLGAGFRTTGTLTIANGDDVSSRNGYLGYQAGSTGIATVTGIGSSWTVHDDLEVGREGTGTLRLSGGGAVGVLGATIVSGSSGSSGVIEFDDGFLLTGGYIGDLADLRSTGAGVGVVATSGLVSDVNLQFDGANGTSRRFEVPGQSVSVELNVDGTGPLGAGFRDSGALSVTNGASVAATEGWLGYRSGSRGVASVSGAGSVWQLSRELSVANEGEGVLEILDGGAVVAGGPTYVGRGRGSSGSILVDRESSLLTAAGSELNDLYIGDDGAGSMEVRSGGRVLSRSGVVGRNPGSVGSVTVAGRAPDGLMSSVWEMSEQLVVGAFGVGDLAVSDGAAVVNSGSATIGDQPSSSGIVSVAGSDSRWWSLRSSLSVGGGGEGSLFVSDGATVIGGEVQIGRGTEADGAVEVRDSGSLFAAASTITVSDFGRGELRIRDGGEVRSQGAVVGRTLGSLGGLATISGSGSSWSVQAGASGSRSFVVGQFGTGALVLRDGGVVNNAVPAVIGEESGSVGTVTLEGTGSAFNNTEQVIVGKSGFGRVSVTADASVTSGVTAIGSQAGSQGEVIIDGPTSRWTASGRVDIGGNFGVGGAGNLTLSGGGTLSAADVRVLRTGRLQGTGSVNAPVLNDGLVAPGNSPGILVINGDYAQTASGELEIEIGGLTAGPGPSGMEDAGHDRLDVTGTATLAGINRFPLINRDGFTPQAGDELTFLTAGVDVIGFPDAFLMPDLDTVAPDLGFQVFETGNELRLRFVDKQSTLQFQDQSGQTADPMDWHRTANWSLGALPETSDIISIDRADSGQVQRIEISADDAYTHDLTIGDPDMPIEIFVSEARTLSAAVGNVTIEQNGLIELAPDTRLAAARGVEVLAAGELRGNGTVLGSVDVMADGLVSPGQSVGSLQVDGDYTQSEGAALRIEIESVMQDGQVVEINDVIRVEGDVSLAGTVEFDLSLAEEIELGDEFEILIANGGGGEFDRIELIDPNGVAEGLYFDIRYEGFNSDGVAQAAATICGWGDIDCSGTVDEIDLTVFAAALLDREAIVRYGDGQETFFDEYVGVFNFNGDDFIDFGDLRGLMKEYAEHNQVAISTAYTEFYLALLSAESAVRVPEPATAVLVSYLVVVPMLGRFGRGVSIDRFRESCRS